MDPFARKMIFAGLAFGGVMVLMAGAASVLYFHFHPWCSDQVLSETASPDKQWTAAVMLRRCGEESPFFIHVNLRRAAESVRLGYFYGQATEGEVLVAEQDAPDVVPELEWTAPHQLTIRCPRCRAAQKLDERWGPVQVRYEAQR